MDMISEKVAAVSEKLSGGRIELKFCEQFDEKSDVWNFNRHKHDCIEILYFLYGNADVTTSDSSMVASFYDIVVYPRETYHIERLQQNHHQEIICLWVDIPSINVPHVINIQDTQGEVKWLLEKLVQEYKSEYPSEHLIDYLLKAAIVKIAKLYYAHHSEHDAVSTVIQYMQDHMDEKITVEDLSKLIYVSKSYLSRVFKNKTGMSLMEFLRLIRIDAAKQLLLTTNKTVEEISYIIGFRSPKYFCRAFKEITTMSPREYKKSEKYKY